MPVAVPRSPGPPTTVWVLGDQLNRGISSLIGRRPGDCRILFVESSAKLVSKRWHIQRLHLVVSAMAHFADELRAEGFEVDYRCAATLADGLQAHRCEFDPAQVIAMEPMSYDGLAMLRREAVEVVAGNQFLCHYGVFMDAGTPVGGRWNFDHDNRLPPPKDARRWPAVTRFEHDSIDNDVIARLPSGWGAPPDGTWPVTRAQALVRLSEFIEHGLDSFGAHEDAMLAAEWKLAHSVLSSSLNLGLLHPGEVVAAAEHAYRLGRASINSVEGFIRQIIGWREYVWGVYWLWMPEYRTRNALEAHRPVPAAFTGDASTEMACVRGVISHVHDRGYTHHIERLMVLGNFALIAGVSPQAMTDWMWATFVDGAEWVMVPNVIGMALHADGGRMATKPYAAGGAYINRMSDYCRGCRYDPKQRTGPNACPFTTLYWDFLARNEPRLRGNHRLAQQLAAMRNLADLPAVRTRVDEVLAALDAGEL
jgi:deoxyribodipyrimidine photolyase-related protein